MAVLDLAAMLRSTLRERARRLTGLTLEQALVLCRIERRGGQATISRIARDMAREPHTVSGMVDRLEKRGLALRRRSGNPHGSDGRHVEVSLTAKGRRQIEAYRRQAQSILASLQRFPPGDLQARLDQLTGILQEFLKKSE